MLELGYAISSEEHSPHKLVRHAAAAEEAGFSFALISDHFHPWTDTQGHTHRGRHYTVSQARLYSVPDEPPPIAVAAAAPEATELAGRIGDALIATSPDAEQVEQFSDAGGADKPRYGQLTVCWAEDEHAAIDTAYEWWPNAALEGELGQELPLPRHFEQAAATLTREQVAASVVCGPDPERHREAIQEFADAGFDHVYVHQVGPDQAGFLRFYEREILARAAVS